MDQCKKATLRAERISSAMLGRGRNWFAVVVVGMLSALAAACVRLGFRALQDVLTGFGSNPPGAAAHLHAARRAWTPVLGAALATAVLLWQRRASVRRSPAEYVEYVEAVQQRQGFVPLGPNLWRTASAAFSVASGAAVGREGSMIQFAAAVGSVLTRQRWWQRWLGGDDVLPPALLVTCGVAGGVTAAYNTPVAAIFFAAEIVLGKWAPAELAFLAVAAFAGFGASGCVLGWDRLYPTPIAVPWSVHLLWLVPGALLFGVMAPVYQWALQALRGLRRLPGPLLWSGAVVGALSLLDVRVWGNGEDGLRAALGIARVSADLQPAGDLGHLLALRLAATLGCVWTGTVGGVFTPTLFAGGALGSLLGHAAPAAGLSAALCALVGMSCLLSGATHAPIMAACMAAELTGNWRLLPMLLALNWVAYRVARRLSSRALYRIATPAPEAGHAVHGASA